MISVGAEASLPQEIETIQGTAIPHAKYDVTHRDVIMSGVVGLHAPRKAAVQLAAIGGASLIQERFSVRSTSAPFGSSAFPPFSDPVRTTQWAFALVAGADLDLAVARHVSVAPELRLQWIPSYEDARGALGLGSIVWQPAVALRVHF